MEIFGSFFLFIIIALGVIAANTLKIVRQSTVGVVERLGQFQNVRNAGLTMLIPFIDTMTTVDMREQVVSLPSQPVITRDNVTMNIDAVIYFQVTDPFRATYEISNLVNAVEKLALTTIRNVIGEMNLDETLSSRDDINNKLQIVLDEATGKWGLKVNRVEMKDINPPRDIEEAMQKQMRAEREKRAIILLAEGEKESKIRSAEGEKQSQILQAEGKREAQIREAEGHAQAIRLVQEAEAEMTRTVFAAINESHPSKELLQLKYLEALQKVSEGRSNTLILPYESAAFMGALAGSARTLASQGATRGQGGE